MSFRRRLGVSMPCLVVVAGLVASSALGAPPAFRGVSSAATSGPSSSLTIATPSGVHPGDLMLAALDIRLPAGVAITAPAGWPLVRRDNNDPAYASLSQALYYRVADGSEPPNYTWRWTFPRGVGAAGGIVVYSGVDRLTPIDAHSGRVRSYSRRIVAPSVTTTAAEDLVVALFGHDGAKATTSPAGTVNRWDKVATGGSSAARSKAADFVAPGPGPTGDKVAVTSGSGSSSAIGQLVALRPEFVGSLAPINIVPPSIQGIPIEGRIQTADLGFWWSPEPPTYTYQWRRCNASGGDCWDIDGATLQTYGLTSADVGWTLRIVVTASNTVGSTSATSAPTSIIEPPSPPPPPSQPPPPPPPPPSPPPPTGRWWSSSSPWNTPLNGSETIDAARTTYIQGLGNYQIVWKNYGVAFYQAPAGTPRYTVLYSAQGLYLHDVPIPANVYPAAGSDAHLSILDTDPNSPTSGCVFDFLHAGRVGGSGMEFDYSNPRGEYVQRERLFTESGFVQGASTRGSSNANLGGILTSQELAAGQINHAIALYVPAAQADNGQVHAPSYTSDGTSTSSLLPEGARVQVDPAWNPSGLPAWQQTLVRALQTYGGFIIDQGGRDIPAIDNTHSGYGPTYPWGSTDYPQLDVSITQHMQVLSLGGTVSETYDPIMQHPCGNFTTSP